MTTKFEWSERHPFSTRRLIADGRATGFTVRRLPDDSWVVAYQAWPVPGTGHARTDPADARRGAMAMAERFWVHSRDHRKCLVCDADLSKVMSCMVFVARREIPEQIALLCTPHGSNGANNVTEDRFRLLLAARDSRRIHGVVATAPEPASPPDKRSLREPTLPCGCPLDSRCEGLH
jgi:hypothetical protein